MSKKRERETVKEIKREREEKRKGERERERANGLSGRAKKWRPYVGLPAKHKLTEKFLNFEEKKNLKYKLP